MIIFPKLINGSSQLKTQKPNYYYPYYFIPCHISKIEWLKGFPFTSKSETTLLTTLSPELTSVLLIIIKKEDATSS